MPLAIAGTLGGSAVLSMLAQVTVGGVTGVVGWWGSGLTVGMVSEGVVWCDGVVGSEWCSRCSLSFFYMHHPPH